MRKPKFDELKEILESGAARFNVPGFIKDDPVSIPHLFTLKEDVEISAFITATISWGQRPVILSNATKFMELMYMQPHEFVLNAGAGDLKRFKSFVHRTFNGIDAAYFLRSLQMIYLEHGGLESLFRQELQKHDGNMGAAISAVRSIFLSHKNPGRTSKHFSDPQSNSAAKRINMMLRWLVRSDKNGVDFGLWKSISPSQLFCPLDVHSGRVARELGLLKRKQDDWKAVEELTASLRKFDADDPVKYDFALFGMGVEGKGYKLP